MRICLCSQILYCICECLLQLNLFASLQQCRKACKLPFPEVRVLVKTLKKKHLIQEVHQDVAKQRVAWWVTIYSIVQKLSHWTSFMLTTTSLYTDHPTWWFRLSLILQVLLGILKVNPNVQLDGAFSVTKLMQTIINKYRDISAVFEWYFAWNDTWCKISWSYCCSC